MQIAAITSGKYYYAPDASILISIYQEISELIENRTTEAQQDSDTIQVTVNNVKPEIKPFGPYIVNIESSLNITTMASDLGSDDLTFSWSFEYGPTITNIFYNDGVGADPYPSPG